MSAGGLHTGAAAGPAGGETARPARAWARRWATAGIVLAALAAAALAGWARGGPEHGGALDPQNPDPDGARAVARVLERSGVRVDVARGEERLEDALGGPGSPEAGGVTVVVTGTDDLGPRTARGLLAATEQAELVLVGPGIAAAELLGLPGAPTRTGPVDDVAADCADETFAGLSVEADRGLALEAPGCFGVDEGSLLARGEGPSVLGAPGVLSNGQVLRADNAAVALRLLGGRDRLVWYVPDLADLDGGDPVGVAGLLPDWLLPGLGLLTLAAIAGLAWRGRRLGPLATEPLPVRVRALESTHGRGRLYHRSGDRAHAARALRRGTRHRAAASLGLPPRAAGPGREGEALVAALARATGRGPDDLRALVADEAPPPHGDDDLTTLARRLAELEREVRPT